MWHGSERANLSLKVPIHSFDDVLSSFGPQRRNSRTQCNRCGHRCNIFMLWTGRVRAINSRGVGRVKERDKTHVGGQFAEARGARAITFPKPLALSRNRVTGTTIHHRFAPYNPRANLQPRPPSPVSSRAPRPTGPFTAPEQPYSFVSSLYVHVHGGMQFRCRECALPDERPMYRVSVLELLQKKEKI